MHSACTQILGDSIAKTIHKGLLSFLNFEKVKPGNFGFVHLSILVRFPYTYLKNYTA